MNITVKLNKPFKLLPLLIMTLLFAACGNSGTPIAVQDTGSAAADNTLQMVGSYDGIEQGMTGAGRYTLGSPDAGAILYIYSDFLCSTCRAYVTNTEPQIIEQYVKTGKLRLEFRDVLDFGERSLRASEAAACAGKLGKFWQMHTLLYENQLEVSRTPEANDSLADLMLSYGARIEGLDQQQFGACIRERQTMQQVQNNDAERRSNGITLRPSFEIGELRIYGPQPFGQMAKAIDQVLGE